VTLLVKLLAYKNLSRFTPWARPRRPPAAVAISAAAVRLLLRLFPNPIEPLVTFPNLHESLPDPL
jgi:hypothetical protein